ncbi:MAG TPA: DUF1028 domain-containing protein [Nitrolancea sp.]|jgi:uncharacterized Ntn-hydrolase superfamily protein|nr:DUF1028 domain-containing protein [Nitrolancea sp.]
MTFSVIGYDARNGDVGMVISTWALAVGSRVPNAEAGVGAVATQANTNANLGPRIIDLLRAGKSPHEAVETTLASDSARDQRQVVAVDTRGQIFAWTGATTKPWSGHHVAENVATFGNLLVGEQVLSDAMSAYQATSGELRDRLLAAYRAGQAAGGDAQGVQSAVLFVARINVFPFIDLRVDDHPSPIDELHRLAALADASIVPRLPQLEIDLPEPINVGQPARITVSASGQPVSNITISANRQFRGLTGPDGVLTMTFDVGGDYYLVAAQPPTSTRAAASYQFIPAVRWIRIE